jgi:hypothetical protein
MEPSVPPPDPSVDLEAWVIHTRLAQRLPARVEDPTVLARIAESYFCASGGGPPDRGGERTLTIIDHIRRPYARTTEVFGIDAVQR